jgi:hypothetical protein
VQVLKTALAVVALARLPPTNRRRPRGRCPPRTPRPSLHRAGAEAFNGLDAALAAGYEPLFDCTEAGADGAMGQH